MFVAFLTLVTSACIASAKADKIVLPPTVISAKVPSSAQKMLDAIDMIIGPIKESLDLEMLEQALPKQEKAIKEKRVDRPALRWDFDKRLVKFARR